MRRLRFTRRAAAQIEAALAFVSAASPKGARDVQTRLRTILALVQELAAAGRSTTNPMVRRIDLTPYRYLIDYRATEAGS